MFGGLMSRCMKPALCTTSSPSRSGAASAATCASASGRRTPTQSGSGAPSTNSITMYAVPFASKKRITRTMFGAERGEGARLVEKAAPAPVEDFRALVGARCDRAVGRARGNVGRQVFLDRDPEVQVLVQREIGEAETANAEHLLDAGLLQRVARGQGVGGFHRALSLVDKGDRLLQAAAHAVERLSELRHLVAAGVGEFGGVEAALGNLLGGVRKPRDRPDYEKREHNV